MSQRAELVRAACPPWCVRHHRGVLGEDDLVHVSGALQVRRTVLRVVATADPDSGATDGPYLLVGQDEYTVHEAEVLIGALTQLVDEARAATAPAVPRMRPPGP